MHGESHFIGPRLKSARERLGYSQADLAKAVGVDPAMVSRWEFSESTRYTPVPADRLVLLAQYLDVDVHFLAPNANGALTAMMDGVAKPLVNRPAMARYATSEVSSPSPVPGRPERTANGEYRLRLRCPSCHKHNEVLSADPSQLPRECLGCGLQLRARVKVTLLAR